jgi:hypothetical protein
MDNQQPIVDKLSGGKRGSVGDRDEVAEEVREWPFLFDELFAAILHPDPIVAGRAAGAAEQVSKHQPELLQPHKTRVLNEAAASPAWEVKAAVCRMIPRLEMRPAEYARAITVLEDYLEERSSIVGTFAMQGLVDLALRDASLLKRIRPVIEALTISGTAAMRARGRKLLKILDRI